MTFPQSSRDPVKFISGPTMSDAEFSAIAAFTHRTFGLNLLPSKREMVFARLIKRLKLLGIKDFKTYLDFVIAENNTTERSEFLSALTTNVTHFFREMHHFVYLRDILLDDLIDRAKSGKKIRIWSAGCSAGQEAYSIAMVVAKKLDEKIDIDFKILATDIDTRILETAKNGTYPELERKSIPDEYFNFLKIPTQSSESFSISEKIKKMITFAELNLIAEWPMQGSFDVIFCRNVAIYFDADTQSTLWKRFYDYLSPGGHLFIGHSERVNGLAANALKTVGVTAYVKQNTETATVK